MHVGTAVAKVFSITDYKMQVHVKGQLQKKSTVYLLASVGKLFVMISIVSPDVPLRSGVA